MAYLVDNILHTAQRYRTHNYGRNANSLFYSPLFSTDTCLSSLSVITFYDDVFTASPQGFRSLYMIYLID